MQCPGRYLPIRIGSDQIPASVQLVFFTLFAFLSAAAAAASWPPSSSSSKKSSGLQASKKEELNQSSIIVRTTSDGLCAVWKAADMFAAAAAALGY